MGIRTPCHHNLVVGLESRGLGVKDLPDEAERVDEAKCWRAAQRASREQNGAGDEHE